MFRSAVEKNRHDDRLFSGRELCARCRRPVGGCYCAHVKPIDTRTRLVLLQHPRERYVAIGTAHMASLCLTNSELHVGIDWSRSEPLARALSDRARPPILLYPGEGSIDIVEAPPPGPVTLVVVDGTWAQTKKVVRTNPLLAALPRYAFVPPQPSEYRIRKEPDDASVATIEALVHALTALEGDQTRFAALLAPFRAMIDFQIDCQQRFHGARVRHARRRDRLRRFRVPRVLSERFSDVVCVAGEANAWPYTMRAANPAYTDELVQWAAHRPATGETMAFVVAPRGDVAPGTTLHTRLDEATLRAGGTLDELHARWRAFVRDSDVVCSWGRYETSLFAAAGGWAPKEQLDLRHVARDVARGTVGSLADYHERLIRERPDHDHARGAELLARVPGRAGHKLRAIGDVIASFTALHAGAASAP
ncbi:MAG: DTW domain-containing protein [Labilithrix sp.]|nr:DTW domain-containing protein [Labilithrix sp.]